MKTLYEQLEEIVSILDVIKINEWLNHPDKYALAYDINKLILSKQREAAEKAINEGIAVGQIYRNENDIDSAIDNYLKQYDQP